jgi:hypothetical protein
MSDTNKKPTHLAYAYTVHQDAEHATLRLIGAAWPHEDGQGFTLELDRLPDIVLRTLRKEPGPTLQPSTVAEFA